MEALVTDARALGVERLFCLTFEVDFFTRHGFEVIEGQAVEPEVYAELLRSYDEGVAEFLDLERVKPNTLGNTRMLRTLYRPPPFGRSMRLRRYPAGYRRDRCVALPRGDGWWWRVILIRTEAASTRSRSAEITPKPRRGISGSAIPIPPPTTQAICRTVSDHANTRVRTLVDVALDDGVAAQLDQLRTETGDQPEDQQGRQRGEQRRREGGQDVGDQGHRDDQVGSQAAQGVADHGAERVAAAAAPTTRARTKVPLCPGRGCSRIRKAMNRVRNPVSSRAPTALQRAVSKVTGRAATRARRRWNRPSRRPSPRGTGSGPVSSMSCSPMLESTRTGAGSPARCRRRR